MPHVCKCYEEISEQSSRIAELEQRLAASQEREMELRGVLERMRAPVSEEEREQYGQ